MHIHQDLLITIEDQHFRLCPEKAVFWEEESCLLIADLHLGKAGHFRKNGIAIPPGTEYQNLNILDQLMGRFKVQDVLFLGDLFHSEYNQAVRMFDTWIRKYAALNFKLINGNHDVMEPEVYRELGIELLGEFYRQGSFGFVHDPSEAGKVFGEVAHIFGGHLHPGVRMKGKGRMSVRLACFLIGQRVSVLPAFGKFTGNCTLKPRVGDKVFIIADDKVKDVSQTI